MDIRRMSLTEVARDALRLWVETPADHRATSVSPNGHTVVLQEFAARVDALEAAVATLRRETPVSADTMPYDNSNTPVIHEPEAARPADDLPQPTGYGALAGQVQAYAAQHQGAFTCAEAAQALHATSKQVNQVLKRLVKQGLMETEGRQRQAVYVWLGA
jgi:hypothetical protein